MLDRNAPAPMLGLDAEPPFAFVPSEEAARVARGECVVEEMEEAPADPAWENLILATSDFVVDDSERSTRARRSIHQLVGPFIPSEVFTLSQALGLLLTGMLYDSRPGARERRRKLLEAVFREAAIVKEERAA